MTRSQETTQLVQVFLQEYIDEYRKSPTIREIATGCFVSVGTVMRHLDKLEATGLIEREPNQARSIILLRCEKTQNSEK